MATLAPQWPCNTKVKITEVSEVEGNRGAQWKLACEFPWTGQYAETVWVNIDFNDNWRPEPGSTYPVVVNRRDLKEGKDESTEWNWRHWINKFTHEENLPHYRKQGYSAPSNQSPATASQDDASPTPVALSSGTIGDVLEGGQFGMLFKAAIFEEKDQRATDEQMNYVRIQEVFLDLLQISETIKSMPMISLDPEPVPLQDDPPKIVDFAKLNDERREQPPLEATRLRQETQGQDEAAPNEPDSMRDGPDPTQE